MTVREFEEMTVIQVYMRLSAYYTRQLEKDNDLRKVCFHLVAPHWNAKKYGPLKWLWQLWKIPEIDGDIKDYLPLAVVTKVEK